jgi:hypothetical protein
MAYQRPKNETVPSGRGQPLDQSQKAQTQPVMVPKFVETEKQVLRFLCHITEMERGAKRPTPVNIRFFTLLIYLEDNSFEIIEDRIPNSGNPLSLSLSVSHSHSHSHSVKELMEGPSMVEIN